MNQLSKLATPFSEKGLLKAKPGAVCGSLMYRMGLLPNFLLGMVGPYDFSY